MVARAHPLVDMFVEMSVIAACALGVQVGMQCLHVEGELGDEDVLEGGEHAGVGSVVEEREAAVGCEFDEVVDTVGGEEEGELVGEGGGDAGGVEGEGGV